MRLFRPFMVRRDQTLEQWGAVWGGGGVLLPFGPPGPFGPSGLPGPFGPSWAVWYLAATLLHRRSSMVSYLVFCSSVRMARTLACSAWRMDSIFA